MVQRYYYYRLAKAHSEHYDDAGYDAPSRAHEDRGQGG